MEGLEHLENDYELGQFLVATLISFATQDGGGGTPEQYIMLRKHFMDNSLTKVLLPDWIRVQRNEKMFWNFIKQKFAHYQERRNFIWKELSPLLDYCESNVESPAAESISEVMLNFDESGIYDAWQRAKERISDDPEGAITLSRSILESVCKHILDEKDIEYDSTKIELHELYKKTAVSLNLSPSQHTEAIFKQILGGCSAIINGLGQLRNKLGDAHGKGKKPVKPASRHAELAVNLTGSVTLFLIETYNKDNI